MCLQSPKFYRRTLGASAKFKSRKPADNSRIATGTLAILQKSISRGKDGIQHKVAPISMTV